jgi:ribonuclease III
MSQADERLEQQLGHKFRNPLLLERALTHSSAIPDLRASRGGMADSVRDNEQLEFLGDAVLDMLASEHLLEAFPDWSEGHLSKSRARVVNAHALARAAQRVKLGEHLRLGRGEEKTGGREKPALLANAFEAVIAAIYLDAGLDAARQVLCRTLFEHALGERGESIAEPDRKSALQEFLQGRGQPPAEYRIAGATGPDHQKTFLVEVMVNGACMASAEGSTKKEAEQRAARTALERLEQASPKGWAE